MLTNLEIDELLERDDPEMLQLAMDALARRSPEAARAADALFDFITDTEFGGP